MRVNVEIPVPRLPRRRPVRVLAVLTIALALVVPGVALASHLFDDVDNSSPFHGNISALALSGVTAGCGGNNFCPGDNVTREQMAAFMTRGMGRIAEANLTFKANTPTTQTTSWAFSITPGIPGGAVAGATQFIKVHAVVTLQMHTTTGCPCKFRGQIKVSGTSATSWANDTSLFYNDQFQQLIVSGAVPVTGAGAQTIEVQVWRVTGSGDAYMYGTATAETIPLGASGGTSLGYNVATTANSPAAKDALLAP
jgi:hypothetical protein